MIKKTPILLALAILTAGCAEQIEPAEPSASGDVSTTMAKVRTRTLDDQRQPPE